MRTCLALLFALMLLASPYFFAYLEAERLLGWPEAVYQWFDPWLPLAMILAASLVTFALPWILSLFGNQDHRP
jgi:hypothetical protein